MTSAAPPERQETVSTFGLVGLVSGPAAFFVVIVSPAPAGLSEAGWSVAAVLVLMAIWWISQAIPLPATALLPVILFPLLGVTDLASATAPYANPLIFLFLGGFVVALTIQRWNLHRRIAIAVIGFAGIGPRRLIGGFMLATAGLSMWVSNTATTLMMVPIAISVISYIEIADEDRAGAAVRDRFARGLLLAIAYAASIGGLATLIGTPPNAFLAGYVAQNHGIEIGFASWMMLGLPVSAVMLAIAWYLLTRVLFRTDGLSLDRIQSAIHLERSGMGALGKAEKLTAGLFIAVGLLWVLRPLLDDLVPISDVTIAVGGALAAFLIPVDLRERTFLMDWEHATKLPWGILLLFGAGLSLAFAIDSSGLAAWLADGLSASAGLSLLAILLLIVGFVVFLTEVSSNTATAAVFVPVAATFAASLGHDPMILAVPTALAASCAFMMPVATPPNAIVFGSGHLTVMQMCRAGVLLNLAATAVIAVAALYLVPLVF
jgi:sodium-dependent dicarboxylate transporter 2/3/5